jgi:CRISPR-associated protein Cas8a1/Csx13
MIQNAQWDEEAQKLFVRACHETLRKIYAKTYDRTQKGDYAQIERETERIRSELLRCTNAESFRSFLLRFWSRAGQVSITQVYWEELLPLTTGRTHWKVGRDLALFALVSYKPSQKSQAEYSENSEESFDKTDSPQRP